MGYAANSALKGVQETNKIVNLLNFRDAVMRKHVAPLKDIVESQSVGHDTIKMILKPD